MTDLRRHVVYLVVVGSRGFGLATESSDEDRRGVYLPPAELTWSLDKPPGQIEWREPGVEVVCWELEKFLRLALDANPNLLECLWAPAVLHADETGRELRDLRGAFLSRKLYKTYSGYVESQFALLKRRLARTGDYKPKHAMHLVRLLLSGVHALRSGDILVDVGEHREELLRIKRGDLTFEEVRTRVQELDRSFQEAFASTRLPESPDYERVNRFLIRSRRRAVDVA